MELQSGAKAHVGFLSKTMGVILLWNAGGQVGVQPIYCET